MGVGNIAPKEAPNTVNVLIADDEALLRTGIRLILEAAADLTAPMTCTIAEAVSSATHLRPDVVLLGIQPPAAVGLKVLGRLRSLETPPHVAVLSSLDSDSHIGEVLRLGATGFLLRDTDPDVLTRSVRALATGAGCLSAPIVRRLSQGFTSGDAPGHLVGKLRALSARERQTLHLLGHGHTNAEIGRQLNISTTTVKDYVKAVLAKLGVTNRVQAAVIATRTGACGWHVHPNSHCC
ncbi:response regulator transcription factor [Streptomyces mobaraensis NBRC 13819 = DSM 40847]|uniref:Two-component system response regulator n=1 Tax=Streptomyces mobaraensis (strain ATCC 29032 / DSM 40847 / JCM 4168 / NBRC 13819 / NCIMB 11159 / IPCR 16-22) TaxID=1223523 RepID=M3BCM2_STRM1|nr:response regulator transcription factor [Streptomyces mobaraensis]EME97304.1 two-component system response regulator [Streptomyces mobaraensis NBRC 13819 = DSM 40847]QTT73638.1 response regulator transcription factor [Streptomyces mobaraensis NBRC 13819 = DSM 40847]